jgi:hypothetical protein
VPNCGSFSANLAIDGEHAGIIAGDAAFTSEFLNATR